ncbi:galactose-binding transporter, partial [Escherichia coli]
ADRNRSHWSTSKTPSYTKSVSWQHHRQNDELALPTVRQTTS